MSRAALSLLLNLLGFSILAVQAHAGQFRHVVYYSAGQRPFHVVTAQFTHSGNLDLAMIDYLSDQLCVLLGKGDGTFRNASCISGSFSLPYGIATGDFNEDGNLDIAVVETGGTGHGDLKIFLGDGKGSFRLFGTYQTGVGTVGVAVADFNRDGHLDVAVTNFGFGGVGWGVMTFFGDGHGKMGERKTYKMTGSPDAIAAGDLDGDGSPDLAVTQFSDGAVAVLVNDGTGHFKNPVSYNAGGGEVVDVKIADLRNDGRNDLVAVNGSKNELAVLLNKGDGTFDPAKFYVSGFSWGSGTEAVAIADFNLDGHLDLAAVNQFNNSALLYGRGDGTFGPAHEIFDGERPNGGYSIAAGVFRNGHAPDLAIPIQNDGEIAIMINTQ